MIVFLDDILIYSAIQEEYIQHLNMVFDLLREHKLFAKESKCEFLKIHIHYLGHVISSKGIAMDMTKVNAILHWPHPRNLEELQFFLGLAGFYRKYVRRYTKIVVPMTNQLKAKGRNFFWGEEQQRSFDKLSPLHPY